MGDKSVSFRLAFWANEGKESNTSIAEKLSTVLMTENFHNLVYAERSLIVQLKG